MKGYYDLPWVAATLRQRLDALKSVIHPGSAILDVGCNDGRIGLELLNEGVADHYVGIDLEDILVARHPQFRLIVADIADMEPSAVPAVDCVLALNILHHLIVKSSERAGAVLDLCLSKAPMVIVDLGSFSENVTWRWRKCYDALWQSDEEMWADLFSRAQVATPLATYNAPGGGTRTMWVLRGRRRCQQPA
jgi:SAM-dependent methyltransferase